MHAPTAADIQAAPSGGTGRASEWQLYTLTIDDQRRDVSTSWTRRHCSRTPCRRLAVRQVLQYAPQIDRFCGCCIPLAARRDAYAGDGEPQDVIRQQLQRLTLLDLT